jgi:hypothetical protein
MGPWHQHEPGAAGGLTSRSGFYLRFYHKGGEVYAYDTHQNYDGNLPAGWCGKQDTVSIKFEIPTAVFEAMDAVVIELRPDAFYVC